MGLYASITPEDMGFQSSLDQEVMGELFSVEIDYSSALSDAADTFVSLATDYVPVDTGYLQSTIGASSDGQMAEFYANAEYAQYPEYGTWCQSAQPYFRPALEEAMGVFYSKASELMSEAMDELQSEIEDYLESMAEEMGGESGAVDEGMTFLQSMIATVLIYLLLFPFLIYAYGIVDSLSLGSKNDNNYETSGMSSIEDFIEIT